MNKKFSIIFPTRERPDLLRNILKTIRETTANINDVEVLIAYDSDDQKTHEFIDSDVRDGLVCWFECKRSLNFSRDYYSMMAKQARGRWLLICNDDVEFRTKDWDILADKAMSDAVGDGPDIMYGWVEDGLGAARMTQFNNYTCFPLLGKAGVDALGCVFPDDIPTWGADIWVRYLYGQIGKMVEVPITVFHLSHHNGTREQDDINKRIQANQVKFSMHPTDEQINTLTRALRAGRV